MQLKLEQDRSGLWVVSIEELPIALFPHKIDADAYARYLKGDLIANSIVEDRRFKNV